MVPGGCLPVHKSSHLLHCLTFTGIARLSKAESAYRHETACRRHRQEEILHGPDAPPGMLALGAHTDVGQREGCCSVQYDCRHHWTGSRTKRLDLLMRTSLTASRSEHSAELLGLMRCTVLFSFNTADLSSCLDSMPEKSNFAPHALKSTGFQHSLLYVLQIHQC